MSHQTAIIAGILGPGLCTYGLFIWHDRWKLGALALNAFKGCFATIFIACAVAATTSNYAAVYTKMAVWQMIIASFLGIVVADTWWLLALEILGARNMVAIDSIKPFLSIGFGVVVLNQRISVLGIAGIFVTTAGIVLVNLERQSKKHKQDNRLDNIFQRAQQGKFPLEGSNAAHELLKARGIKLIATNITMNELRAMKLEVNDSASLGTTPRQAVLEMYPRSASSSIMSTAQAPVLSEYSSKNIAVGYWYAFGNVVLDLWAATIVVKYHDKMSVADVSLIKFGFGAVVLSLAYGAQRLSSSSTTNYSGSMSTWDWAAICFGVLCVTVVTPMLTTYTYFKLPLAIAVTLNSIAPLWSLPISRYYGEQVNGKAVAGAFLATGGVVMLVAGVY